jgi:hypothetical protein
MRQIRPKDPNALRRGSISRERRLAQLASSTRAKRAS